MPVAAPGAIPVLTGGQKIIPEANPLVLESILATPSGKVAKINGEIYTRGNRVHGAVIIRITRNSAVLQKNGKTIVLEVIAKTLIGNSKSWASTNFSCQTTDHCALAAKGWCGTVAVNKKAAILVARFDPGDPEKDIWRQCPKSLPPRVGCVANICRKVYTGANSEKFGPVILQGIIATPEGPAAVIDNTVHRVGDKVRGETILSIGHFRVTLERYGITHEIRVKRK